MSVSRSSVRVRSDCVTEAASLSSSGIELFWKLDFREMMLIFGLMLLLQTAACESLSHQTPRIMLINLSNKSSVILHYKVVCSNLLITVSVLSV